MITRPAATPRLAGIVLSAWASVLDYLAAEIFGSLLRLISDTGQLYQAHVRAMMLDMGFQHALVEPSYPGLTAQARALRLAASLRAPAPLSRLARLRVCPLLAAATRPWLLGGKPRRPPRHAGLQNRQASAAQPAGQALGAAALSAVTGSQPSCFHTILPEAEVSTNHGWSCTPYPSASLPLASRATG
ncbi:MAG TPA: hypothetical protein VK162_00525 [Streptosporangiaceae bacterium]|nr:hypothetical protein [Streptosporangiaceae bacterium]